MFDLVDTQIILHRKNVDSQIELGAGALTRTKLFDSGRYLTLCLTITGT